MKTGLSGLCVGWLLGGALLGSCLLGAAKADYVIVQRVEGGRDSGTMTLKIKGAKSRADLAPQISVITDGVTGDVITLAHALRRFMRIPAERTGALVEKMEKHAGNGAGNSAGNGGSHGAEPKPVLVGRREKVDKYECDVFIWSGKGLSATYWVARNYPNYAAITAALEQNARAGLGALSRGMAPRPGDFSGMIMKTELRLADRKLTTTLVSVHEEELADSFFTVPPEYEEAPTPQFEEL